MPKLTKRVVDAAKAEPKQAFIWDSEVKGFGLSITPAGVKSYVLSYRDPSGQTRRITIGKHGSPWTCDEARTRATELLRGLVDGVDPRDAKSERTNAVTVTDLAKRFLADGPAEKPSKKTRSWDLDRGNIDRHILPLIGREPVKALTSIDVSKMQSDIVNGRTAARVKTRKRGLARVTGGKGTAARTVATLSSMLSFDVRQKIIAVNPAKGVEKVAGRKAYRFLTERELMALFDGLAAQEDDGRINTAMAAAIRLLALTACRKSEITRLQWDSVKLDRSCLDLPDSKTGEKVVPLSKAAVDLLTALPRTSPFVLPSTRGEAPGPITGLQKAWVAVKARATEMAKADALAAGVPADRAPDLTRLRLHDLRHTFASFAASSGTPLLVIGKVLGHKQASTTEIYAHLHDDPLRDAVDRTGERVDKLLQESARKRRRA